MGFAVFGVLGVEVESGLEQLGGDAFAQTPQRGTRRRTFGHDFNIDVLGHTLDHAMRTAQRRAALEDELKRPLVGSSDRHQRPDDKPILFDKRFARQFEMPPDFDQVLELGSIGQVRAPSLCL